MDFKEESNEVFLHKGIKIHGRFERERKVEEKGG